MVELISGLTHSDLTESSVVLEEEKQIEVHGEVPGSFLIGRQGRQKRPDDSRFLDIYLLNWITISFYVL